MNAKSKNKLATITFWAGAGLVLLILGTLLGYIFYHGVKSIDWQFITSAPETIRASQWRVTSGL